ncbi:MAG: alpha-2-macroglobulin family protein, partial [Bacteroidota bacterium]
MSFDSPEALTSWRFRVFAHDQDRNAAVSEQTVVTQKELMVLPNVPRFLREGDALELTARVNNLSEQGFVAKATVEFFDPETNQTLSLGTFDRLSGTGAAGAKYCQEEQRIEAGKGQTFCFPLEVPEGLSEQGVIGYRVIVRGGDYSDGEENVIPILTDRTLITVSQPFYLKRKDKKTVTLPVMAGNNSPSLRHVNYTFQATTNPAWMALKALPYLMEYPYDCTEQIANRFFANQLAYVTVSGKPVLETVFRQWQNDPEALKSELERNPSLKNALLTETPWVRAAQSEAEQRARIGELFDLKKLAEEQTIALDKLAQRQSDNGSYPWFPGGRDNRYVTQYVLESMSRLQQLNAVSDNQRSTLGAISQSAVLFLDQEFKEDYDRLQERMKKEKDWEKDYRPGSTVVHYLYARTMSGADQPGDKSVKKALDFFAERAADKWLDYGLYEQALLAATSA